MPRSCRRGRRYSVRRHAQGLGQPAGSPAQGHRGTHGGAFLYRPLQRTALRGQLAADPERRPARRGARSGPSDRAHPPGKRAQGAVRREGFTTRIVGLPADEAQLLAELYAHSVRPAHIYRHRWQAHDLVFWDNRSLIHLAGGCPPTCGASSTTTIGATRRSDDGTRFPFRQERFHEPHSPFHPPGRRARPGPEPRHHAAGQPAGAGRGEIRIAEQFGIVYCCSTWSATS